VQAQRAAAAFAYERNAEFDASIDPTRREAPILSCCTPWHL